MRRRLTGLLALVGILAVVLGVPWLLVAIGQGPVPSTWPSAGDVGRSLTTPDGDAVVVVLRYAAWLAWLFFVLCLLLEVGARLTGTQPPRLPGLSLPQGAARTLVGAAALLFVAAPVVTSWSGPAAAVGAGAGGVASSAATVAVGATAASVTTDGPTQQTQQSQQEDREASRDTAAETTPHTVAPGETLWSIAEAHLGDGARYPEIVRANPGTITQSSWITPGTTIQLPVTADATADASASRDADGDAGAHVHTVRSGDTLWEIAEDELGEGSRYPEIVAATGDAEQPDGRRLVDPDLIIPGWQLEVPSDGATGASPAPPTGAPGTTGGASAKGSAGAATGGQAARSADADAGGTGSASGRSDGSGRGSEVVVADDPATSWGRTALGLGGITAAGALTLLELTRRRRARVLGRPPSDGLDPHELALGLVADGLTVRTLDLALRHVVLSAERSGRGVPGLRTVRMTRQQVDVQLSSPMRLPAPWTSTADPRLWTLAADRAASLDADELSAVPAPYPGLVTVGQDDEDAYVLVNVVDSRRFAVAGAASDTRAVLAAMVLDLATSPWAASSVVTVVGADARLAATTGSPRVRVIGSAAEHVLSESVTGDSTAREVIVATGDLDDTSRLRLEQAVASSPRVALLHAVPQAEEESESLTVAGDGADGEPVAVLSPSYLQLRPQRLDEDDAAGLARLLDLASASVDVWAPTGEPALARVGAAAAAMGAPGILVDADPGALPVDDAPTRRRADLEVATGRTAPTPQWNTPLTGPRSRPSVPGEDVPTQRPVGELSDIATAADAATPGWLSNQITPTPGTPLPPVIAFPQRVRELTPPTDAPVLRVLGPVDIDNVGVVDEVHRPRLTELAAFVALHPRAEASAIDDAMWPNRSRHDHGEVRERSLGALGAWLRHDTEPAAGLDAAHGLVSDWELWRRLLPGDVTTASTERLEQALGLVRGRPFVGSHPRHYTWAQSLRVTMVHDITLAAAELARRRLMEGLWSGAYDATVVGLTVEPSVEALWRMQLVAAHEMGDTDLVDAARHGLRDLSSRLGDPLEERTTALLAQVEAADAPTQTHHAV